MFTKVKIFNLALSALQLSKQVINADTDTSNEAVVLRTHWDIALGNTLSDLDLDGTTVEETLSLLEEDPNDRWKYAYQYPTNCAFFRRISSLLLKDDRETRIPYQVKIHNGDKVIFTNEVDATGEFIANDFDLDILNPSAGMALAYQLAFLSAALIVGKGSDKLRETLLEVYRIHKANAQKQDSLENAHFDADDVISDFVKVRTT